MTAEDLQDAAAFAIVMGVSGSGKSTIASLLAARLGWTYADADWFHPPENVGKMHAGRPLTDDDRWPWLHAIAAAMADARRRGERMVIACSALKRAYRDLLVGGARDVRIVYLEGARELIALRTSLRHGHFMPPALLDSQVSDLEEPRAEERPIVVPIDLAPGEIVERIAAALRVPTASAAERARRCEE
jgi:gluconokinase